MAAILFSAGFSLSAREQVLLDKGWHFTRDDKPEYKQENVDVKKWQSVTVPHDWAIYGPFSWQNDMQNVAIAQDGQKDAMEHAGRTGGLPFVGTGWYRNTVDVPQLKDGERVTLIFDGAMSHARVYVNGKEAGYWPYGYNSFFFDVTDLVKPGEKNSIAVVRREHPSRRDDASGKIFGPPVEQEAHPLDPCDLLSCQFCHCESPLSGYYDVSWKSKRSDLLAVSPFYCSE